MAKFWWKSVAWGGETGYVDTVKTGTWIAEPYGEDGYKVFILYFEENPVLPTFAEEWEPVSFHGIRPTDNCISRGLEYRTADGVRVYTWISRVGGSYAINPNEWSDLVLVDETFEHWIQTHTKAQIDDLAKENQILVDLYLNGSPRPTMALHWETGNRHHIDAYVSWRPTSTTFYELNYTKGYNALVNKYKGSGLCKENVYLANQGGVQYTWGELTSDTFDTLPKELRIALKGVRADIDNVDVFCLIMKFGLTVYTGDGEQSTYKTTDRIICEIPVNLPQNEIEIHRDVRYVDEGGNKLDLPVIFNVHLNEDIPIDDQDDINSTDDEDDNPDNNGGKNNSDDTDYEDGNGTQTTGLLTTTYSLSSSQAIALGQKLWTQDYFDILKINTDPIQNIISCKAFPFDIAGTTADIKIGNVQLNIQGKKVSNNTKIISVGSINLSDPASSGYNPFNNYLDYAPFTEINVYLPYVGIKPLDVNMIQKKTLSFDYIVDLLTGAGRARVKIGNSVISEYDCTIGVDIPLTSSDRAQADAKHLANIGFGVVAGMRAGAVGAIAGGVSGVINGISDGYHMNQTSGGSPTVSSNDCKDIYLIYNQPKPLTSNGYAHAHGYPCRAQYTLNNLNGYTQIETIDLKGLELSEEEEKELRDILTSGFYSKKK